MGADFNMQDFEEKLVAQLQEYDTDIPDKYIVSGNWPCAIVWFSSRNSTLDVAPMTYFDLFFPTRPVRLIESTGVYGKRVFEYREGSIGFSPLSETYSVKWEGTLEGYSFIFQEETMAAACNAIFKEDYKAVNWRSGKGDYIPAIYYLAQDIASQTVLQFPAGESFVQRQLETLLSMILRRYSSVEQRQTEHVGIQSQVVLSAIYFIEANLDKPLDIARIAVVCGASQTHIRRLFRSETGESLGAYIRRQRLNRAAEYLNQSTEYVDQIGRLCGFPNTVNFHRQFKGHYGMSPLEFRRSSGDLPQ